MNREMELRTPHFGLRDFLFYFVPGGVVLIAILLFFDLTPRQVQGRLGIDSPAAAISLAIFVAYCFGHAVYPLNYLLRKIFAPKWKWLESEPHFHDKHKRILVDETSFYVAIIFRDRSLTRFTIAMVSPTSFLTIGLARNLWAGKVDWPFLGAIILGMSIIIGFIIRFRHYHKRYRKQVLGSEVG